MRQPTDYHTHHSAFGAYGSFTLGALGAGGGFNVHDGRAPCGDEVYVGYSRGAGPMRLLPFSKISQADVSAFATEARDSSGVACRAIAAEELSRQLGWATDTWSAEGLRLSLATPFAETPDPREGWDALGKRLLPVVWAEIEFDNTNSSEDALLVFGIGQGDTGVAALELPGLVGIARQGREGFATTAQSGAKVFCGFSLEAVLGPDSSVRHPHRLGSAFGLAWKVPAGCVGTYPVVLGWYRDGVATTGLATSYGYTRLWKDLDAVLGEALAYRATAWEVAAARDRELVDSGLSKERQWMLAHATRGYFGNTQLLATASGEPVCIVNEGEYCMMNTLDLSVDQVFFESRYFPWFSREVLDLFAARHSFVDELKLPGETRIYPGGVSFCHDMGVRNRFSAAGESSYEIPDLEGCFSHMTFEQACNWPLVAAMYLAATRDEAWCRARGALLEGLLESLERREHPEVAKRQGMPGTDSTRCGSGTEITTYDSLDPSLAQTRQNLYTTTKLWAAHLALERLLQASGRPELADRARRAALRAAMAIESWPERDGILPAIADGRNASAILPAVEGLVYPLHWGDLDAVALDGPFAGMLHKLGTHLEEVLKGGLCRFADGGWRISSTSENSWLSKIWLAQRVAEKVYGHAPDVRADLAHVRWLAPGSASWGFCDQIIAGRAIGSKYYPRGVTSIVLWNRG